MPLPTTKERLGSPQRIMRFFTLVMALVYVALGVWFWVTATTPSATAAVLPLGYKARLILGAVFVLYGLYRLVSALRTILAKPTSDSDEE
ncbi:MAG: hypothetical protein EOO62_15980 [Hymenobacter sp.]|nr:MAG: hypothetical protein EOO62_15980 [Hymenobacter sp.]